jgi:CubicO group peptidase (beta-lactamase class C family)
MQPEIPALGMAPVRDLLQSLARRDMRVNSLLVYRSGQIVMDLWQWPHEPELKHSTFSVTKSFTATAVAFAEAEGLLTLDDRVADFFGDRLSESSRMTFSQMRIRDLLTMRTGHRRGLSVATIGLLSTSWVEEFLREPVVQPPGSTFTYSSVTSHALSAIVQIVTGEPIDVYLGPRIFEPLGITDFSWQRDPEGITSGGYGLSLRPHDLLSFGVLYLNDGMWKGRRILPSGWQRLASALHVRYASGGSWNGAELVPPPSGTITDSGYGLHFWTTDDGIFDASGVFGQECMVFPEHDAVVVVTGAMNDPSYHDFPAMLREAFKESFSESHPDLPAETAAVGEVQEMIVAARSPEEISPKSRRTGFCAWYEFSENAQGLHRLKLEIREESVLVIIQDDRGEHRIEHGIGAWIRQDTGVSVWRLHHSMQEDGAAVLAGAEWIEGEDNALRLVWHFLEGPFIDRLVVRFDEDCIAVEHSVNVNSGATSLPPIRGARLAGEI